jgi:asparagine synthase (glutamine-hydrolysing)
MVSDVPIGAFLSGGVDSSIVCCMMSQFSEVPIKTFSIGFKEKEYDESERAKIVADHIHSDHTQFTLDYSDVINILDDIILYYDEPFGDSSAIPSYYVAKLAKKDVKVVLTGDCADELFGGYEKYLAEYYISKYRKVPKLIRSFFESCVRYCPVTPSTNRILRKIKKVVRNSKCSGFDLYYNMLCQGFDDESRKSLLKPDLFENIKDLYHRAWDELPDDCSFLQKEQIMDVKGVLEGDMFPKVERACMHNSLENRSPFIDKRVLSYAINLSDELKINGKTKKYILKEAFKDVLPEEILKFPKSGFEVPVDYWFMHELKDDLKSLLGKELIDRQNIFDYEYVSSVLDKHLSRKENFKGQLWNLFVFQKWYTKIYEPS